MKKVNSYYVIKILDYLDKDYCEFLVGYNCYSLVPELTENYMNAFKFFDLDFAKKELKFVKEFCCFDTTSRYVGLSKIEIREMTFICL